MKALILNSGMGSRMGIYTSEQPKCMTKITSEETILSRQLNMLLSIGIEEIIITTGYLNSVLINYCRHLDLPVKITFVNNPLYETTNYIYSIYCARKYLQDDNIILMHGDLVFENAVLDKLLNSESSSMVVSSTRSLPEKDFKVVICDDKINKIGIEFFNETIAAQPLYFFTKSDWTIWLNRISEYCENGNTMCYAENAFNDIADQCNLLPLDVKNRLCMEIDNPQDLAIVSNELNNIENRKVYMCFSTDMLHSGHIAIIRKAARLGKLIIGVLSDEAIIGYRRFPLMPYEERKALFSNIKGVYKVVEQTELSYKKNINLYMPDYVVHGDDWKTGIQKSIRAEVVSELASYGGILVEYPYSKNEKYEELDRKARLELSTPDIRRSRLRKAIAMKGTINVMEAHSGLTGLLVENTMVEEEGGVRQFDAMWISSLCDSTAKGKPDIELVDMTSRYRTIDDIMEVTTKPIIFDGDTGGLTEHFIYTVRTLERMGVSMVIIEDKTGLKKNSLFGVEVRQTQDTIPNFCAKISAGKKAQRTKDFMICARIESLILEQGMDDALKRAHAFVAAGADAIMIHSRKKDPSEIFTFVDMFRKENSLTPLVVVPTSFNTVTEEEFKARGVNIVIYANQLTRTAFPAMQNAVKSILRHHRAKECDDICMPFRDIIRLIPDNI